MKIANRINLTFVTIIILFFISFGGILGIYSNYLLKNQAFKQIETINKIKATHINAFIDRDKDLIAILGANNVFSQYLMNPTPELKVLVESSLNQSLVSVDKLLEIFILDAQGKVVSSTDTLSEGKDKENEDLFQNAKTSIFIKSPYFSENSDKLIYAISAPILSPSENKFLGIVAVKINIAPLNSFVSDISYLGETGESLLIDENHFFITSSRFLGNYVILKNKVETRNSNECFKNPINTIQNQNTPYDDYRGVSVFGTYTLIPEVNWCLITKVDMSQVIEPSQQLYQFLTLSGIFLSTIVLVVSLFVSKKLTKPLLELQEGIIAVEKGDLGYKFPISNKDEVGQLSKSFSLMLAQIRHSREEIDQKVAEQTSEIKKHQKSLEDQQKALLNVLTDIKDERNKSVVLTQDLTKFELAVKHASDHIVITDPEGIILYANDAASRITGFSKEEILGKKAGSKELWGGLMPPSFYEQLWKSLKVDKKTFSGEIKNKHKNGVEYIAESNISPVLDSDNNILFYIGIERDITKAKDVDRMKTEFISLASHQLRTPLSAMKWFLEMILAGDVGELTTEQREMISNIDQSNERMIELVNGLLNISRIESGRIIIDPKPTDVKQLISEIIIELGSKFKEHNQIPIVSVHSGLTNINLDAKLIRNVYVNLIANAIKYSPKNSEISIFVSKKDNEILSQISDHGIGIPEKEHGKVFEKFFRAENVIKLETDGTGLGLYLVKAIIESSRGKIWFESKENVGTTFWFTLPIEGMQAKKGEVSLDA